VKMSNYVTGVLVSIFGVYESAILLALKQILVYFS